MTSIKEEENGGMGILDSDNRPAETAEDEYTYEVKEFHKSPKSVYFVNFRSIYEDSYPAKFDPELARMLIGLYSLPGEIVYDPMSGSGVIPLTAFTMRRHGIGQDINPEAIRISTEKHVRMAGDYAGDNMGSAIFHVGDSRKELRFFDDGIDNTGAAGLVLFSPPFGIKAIVGTKKAYSNESEDITNSSSYADWRLGLRQIMSNCYRILQPGRLMIVEIRPRSVDGHDQPMDYWIQEDAKELGFVRWSVITEIYDPWRMYSTKDKDNGMVKPFPGHAFLLIFKKPVQQTLLPPPGPAGGITP